MVPDGAWFLDGTGGAVQIFDCSGLLLRPDHLAVDGARYRWAASL
jgi:hypothetical protein